MGTIKHGISVIDSSQFVWIKDNRITRATGCGVISGSGVGVIKDGIWQHPTDPSLFDGHTCENIRVEGNDFDQVGAGVGIDDRSVLCWVSRNRVKFHYGEAIGVEDGSMWFSVTENICGPGRGAAVMIGHGQTEIWGSRGIVANNSAGGCNDEKIDVPRHFTSTDPTADREAFCAGEGKHVLLYNNLNVPEG